MLCYGYATIGDWTYFTIVQRPIIEDVRNGLDWTQKFGNPHLVEHCVVRGSAEDNYDTFKADYQRHFDHPGSNARVLGLGNLIPYIFKNEEAFPIVISGVGKRKLIWQKCMLT